MYREAGAQPGEHAPDEAKDYSLVLNSGSRVPYHTHSKLRDLPWLNQFMPEPVVRRIRTTPKRAASGRRRCAFNQFGEVLMKAESRTSCCSGVVDVFHGWHQGRHQPADHARLDPITVPSPSDPALCEVERTGEGQDHRVTR